MPDRASHHTVFMDDVTPCTAHYKEVGQHEIVSIELNIQGTREDFAGPALNEEIVERHQQLA